MTDLLDSLMQDATAAVATPMPRVSLRLLTDWFYCDARARNLAPGTIEFYRSSLRFLIEGAGERYPEELTCQHLRLFVNHFREKRKWSPCTTNHFITSLKAFFAYLVKEEIITANPAADLVHLKDDQHLPLPLTRDEVIGILGQCRNNFCGLRDRAMLLTFLDTGLRLNELKCLQVDDVSLELGYIHVRVAKSRRERLVPFSGTTRRALVKYLIQRSMRAVEGALWVTESGTGFQRVSLMKRLEGIADQAGVPGFHVHRLRHTMATEFLRNGGNPMTLQRILGHSTMRMTQRYVHLTDSDAKADHVIASPVERWRLESTRHKPMK